MAELKSNYDTSQANLANFEQESGLNGMVLGAMGQSGGPGATTHVPALDSLDALNQQLVAAETDRIAKEAVYRLTKTSRSRGSSVCRRILGLCWRWQRSL